MPALNPYFVGEKDLQATTRWSSGMISSASGTILPYRASRTSAVITNNTTGTVIVLQGGGAALQNYSAILSKCTTTDDGTGGSYTVTNYPGVVSVSGNGCVVVEYYRQFS